MTDEDIRKAACRAYESQCMGDLYLERAAVAVFRAGMEAGRAEAAAKPKRRKAVKQTVTRPIR